jgi:transcriptional regulator with XRE-family HTH domain
MESTRNGSPGESGVTTFGQVIREARQRAGLSQRALAAQVRREDGVSLSPQYLNDLEWDRRNPPGHHLLRQFAAALDLPYDYLAFVTGCLPDDLLDGDVEPEVVVAAFTALRHALRRSEPTD